MKKIIAKIIIKDAKYTANLTYVAKWLRLQAKELIKNAKLQNKDGKQRYTKNFISKLYY